MQGGAGLCWVRQRKHVSMSGSICSPGREVWVVRVVEGPDRAVDDRRHYGVPRRQARASTRP